MTALMVCLGRSINAPDRLFDPSSVIRTGAISPIRDVGPMTWTG
jgi:hypothetical protein